MTTDLAWGTVAQRPWTPPAVRTVVVSPHPDDEALGAGALIAHQRAAGVDVIVVAVTDGEAAYPGADGRRLGQIRAAEQAAALTALGVDPAATVRLRLRDGEVAAHEATLAERLAALVAPTDLLVAPWAGDHHPDHEACGRAAVQAAEIVGCEVVGTLVWAPVRVDAALAPPELLRLDVTEAVASARRRAVHLHRSQLQPDGAHEPIVGDELLAGLDAAVELYVSVRPRGRADDPTSAAFFDAAYRRDPDPWDFAASPYERGRYDAILAVVGPGPVGPTFEPGCSIGELTVQLATRCSPLVAIDVAPTAVATARRRCGGLDHVTVEVGALPDDIPAGPLDLVVFSEVGYYFDGDALRAIVDDLAHRLTLGGRLIGAHWLGSSADHVLGGAAVHAIIGAVPTLRHRQRGDVEGFVLDEWERADS